MSRFRRFFVLLPWIALSVLAAPASASIEGSTWFPIGPAPIDGFFAGGATGRASAIAVNPANANEVWLGTAAGGVWHSLDNGANWEPESDREDALAIGALALDGCNASGCAVIYAGTGENAIRRDTYYGAGLLIGQSSGGEIPIFGWTQRTGTPFDFRLGSLNDVVLDPATSGATKRIFVTLSSGVTLGAPESTATAPAPASGFGIFRSDDNGATWAQVSVPGSNGAKPTDLKMHPTDPLTLFAGFLGRGVFRSTNGGTSWCPLNAGIAPPPGCPAQGLPNVGSTAFDHVEIAIAPSNPQVVYATFGMCADRLLQNCRPAIFRSANGGASWNQQLAGVATDGSGSSMAVGYSRYTHALAVDPTNPDTLILGGVALWRSTNGGTSFVVSDSNLAPGPGNGVIHSDHREVVFHPTSTNRAYTTGDGGFATSTNGGVNWTPKNDDLQITGFQSLGSSPLTTSVIGASQDNSGQLWSGSRRWKHLTCCGDGGYSFLDFDDPMRMYAGSNFGDLRRSTDGGVFWGGINSGIPAADPRLFYAPFVQDPSGSHPLYFGTNRLFRSTNDGGSWIDVSPVLATGAAPEIVTENSVAAHVAAGTGENVITAIAVAPSDGNRVYLGYYLGQVFRSNGAPCNTLACWTSISTGLPAAPISRIAVHPTQPDTAYVTVSGFGSFGRVWKTTNGGLAWSQVTTGLPAGVPATTVSIEPSVPERVYVGLDSGPDGASLFRSTNGGGAWSAFSTGLPNAPVYEISIDETHGRMYAATHGRGAFVLGKPFISNFEGCIGGSVWDIPVYGQNFLPNQPSCKLSVLQSNGSICASGTVDVMGGTIRTNGSGVLETSRLNMWNGKQVAWACFNGDCIGGTPIEQCNDDADGDGDLDRLSTIVVSCGGELAIATVTGCPPLDNPPSSVVELGLSGFPGLVASGLGGAAVAELGGGTLQEGGVLNLIASVQRAVGTESLCSVAVPYTLGEPDEAVLARARDAVNASPTCAANGVEALLDPGHVGASEDQFPRKPRLLLRAPGLSGSQLITALHTDPGKNTGSCVRIDGVGIPVLNQIQVLKVTLTTPAEGAAGGSLTLVEQTPLGACSLEIPTSVGESGASIAAAIDAAVHAPGIPGPHPDCPSDRNARDITSRMGFLLAVESSSLELCIRDPKVGFDIRTKDLMNAHPIADAGDDRVLGTAPVGLDASLSADPDSTAGTHDDILSFEWFDVTTGTPVTLGTGETLAIPLGSGLHRIRLRATDKGGLADTDEILVTVGGAGGGGGTGASGRWLGSFHVGSTHPLGDLNKIADANIHVRADLGYRLTDRVRLDLQAGFSQLTAESNAGIDHPHFFNLSLDGQLFFPLPSGNTFFLEAGPGIYWPKGGGSDLGFNLGLGLQLPISTRHTLELGADYHRISSREEFVTVGLGVLF